MNQYSQADECNVDLSSDVLKAVRSVLVLVPIATPTKNFEGTQLKS